MTAPRHIRLNPSRQVPSICASTTGCSAIFVPRRTPEQAGKKAEYDDEGDCHRRPPFLLAKPIDRNEFRDWFQSIACELERLVERERENDNRHQKQRAAENGRPKKMGVLRVL
jgi:hypothetical protein